MLAELRDEILDGAFAAAPLGRGDRRDNPIHEVGKGDRPLERLVSAERGTGHRHEVSDAQMLQ